MAWACVNSRGERLACWSIDGSSGGRFRNQFGCTNCDGWRFGSYGGSDCYGCPGAEKNFSITIGDSPCGFPSLTSGFLTNGYSGKCGARGPRYVELPGDQQ